MSTPPAPTGGIAVVAHRGASEAAPEHTLAAYERAIRVGADALECDVRLTADGHVVCVHDRRINRTSDGYGPVSTKTLADLDARDFASWRAPAGAAGDSELLEAQRGVLTLERLLALVSDCGRPVALSIETKHPTRYAGLVEQRLVELLRRHGMVSQRSAGLELVRVMSFSQLSLRRMRTIAPSIPTVFLMDRVPLRFRDGTLPFGARVAGPSIEVVRAHPGYVARARSAGHQVHVWTVNSPSDVELCVDLQVAGIITDRPGPVLEQLGRSPAPR